MEVVKGEWYFGIECKDCEETIHFSHDPSKGMIEVAAHANSVIELTCPVCHSVESYDRSELISCEVKYARAQQPSFCRNVNEMTRHVLFRATTKSIEHEVSRGLNCYI